MNLFYLSIFIYKFDQSFVYFLISLDAIPSVN